MRSANPLVPVLAGALALAAPSRAITASNPFIWADIPDPAMVRVGQYYYMTHTTMHMAPGVPIMRSTDLANWKTIGYAYQTLTNSNAMNLDGGSSAYGKGSWASSIRYKNGTFYILTPSYTTNKTHLYSTKDLENGPWKEVQFPFYHDPSLVLDDDGRNYVVYGSGDIKIVELASDLGGVKSGGMNTTILPGASSVAGSSMIVAAEGSHVLKKNGYYYVFNICWPNGGGRTQICHRSKSLSGPWEAKVVLKSNGVAQGSVIQDSSGGWWGYLFQDNGAVGRSPWIMPVTWDGDWPVFNGGTAPTSVSLPATSAVPPGFGVVTSDDFSGSTMKLEWQWNHNPDKANWSLSARPGYYRITTSRTDAGILSAKNSLTQRSFGQKCSGRIALDATGLKDGDIAGLSAFADSLGFVGVKNNGGSLQVVKFYKGNAQETSVAISQKRVYLRIDMDFKSSLATFFYGLDSTKWTQIGATMKMNYTLGMFMGYRFALFDYATKAAGGYADFDWFQIGATSNDVIDLYPASTSVAPVAARPGAGLRCSPIGVRSALEVGYEQDVAGDAMLSLLDGSGRRVRSLDLGRKGAGPVSARMDVAGLPDGRYLLVVRRDGAVLESRAIALVR